MDDSSYGDWAQGLPHAEQVWYHYTTCPLADGDQISSTFRVAIALGGLDATSLHFGSFQVSGRSRSRFWALPGGAAMLFFARPALVQSAAKVSKRRGSGCPYPGAPYATGVALWGTR